MGRQKREGFAFPALGGSSLLVAFAVLALTVFALLSLSTVRADVRLGDSVAEAVSGWYEADCEAQEILARLRSGETPPGVVSCPEVSGFPVNRCTYSVPISDTQELRAEVLVDSINGTYSVLRWQAVAVGTWTPDDSLTVWDGTVY